MLNIYDIPPDARPDQVYGTAEHFRRVAAKNATAPVRRAVESPIYAGPDLHTAEEWRAHYNAVKARILKAGIRPVFVPTAIDQAKLSEDNPTTISHRDQPIGNKPEIYGPSTYLYLKWLGSGISTSKLIMQETAGYFGVSEIDMKSDRRTKNVVIPRHVAMYMLRNSTLLSLPQIGRVFGGRDHTTILHAVQSVTRLLDEGDQAITCAVSHIRDAIGATQ